MIVSKVAIGLAAATVVLTGCDAAISGRAVPAGPPSVSRSAADSSSEVARVLTSLLHRTWLHNFDGVAHVSFLLPGRVTETTDTSSGVAAREYMTHDDANTVGVSVGFIPLPSAEDVATTMDAYPAAIVSRFQNIGAHPTTPDLRTTTDHGHRELDFRVRFPIANAAEIRVWCIQLIASGTTLVIEQTVSFAPSAQSEPADVQLVEALASKLGTGVSLP